jgi:hypothetical protein
MKVRDPKRRPEDVGHHEFRITDLPEQEIRDPHLASSAKEQIRIGEARGVESIRDRRLIDRLWVEAAFRGVFGDRSCGISEFGAASIIEGERERHSAAVPSGFLTGIRFFEHFGRKAVPAAKASESNVVVHHAASLGEEMRLAELHQEVDLLGRTLPVFAAEGVERERLHPEASAFHGHQVDGLGALTMPRDPRESLRLRPSSIPVHDHREVTGRCRRGMVRWDVVHQFFEEARIRRR